MNIRFSTPKKCKEELVNVFQSTEYAEEIQSISQKNAKLAIDKIVSLTNQIIMKEMAEENVEIFDLFNNANKITTILNKYVGYKWTPDSRTKYSSNSPKMKLDTMFASYESINNSFLKERKDEIVFMLREIGYL